MPNETPNATSIFAPPPLASFCDSVGPDLDIVARARGLHPLIRAHAQTAEDDRRVCDTVLQAINDAGLFRIAVPKRYGGYGANFRTCIDAVAEIGRADGGTGWTAGLINVCTWFATLFSDKAQDEVFGTAPDARACAVFTMPKRCERVSGGFRVSGEWAYASGSYFVHWCVLGVKVGERADGTPIPALALIPFSDLALKDTWQVTAMRATGSNTLVAEDIFVPDYRILTFDNLATENYASTRKDEPNDRASFVPVAEIMLDGPIVGLARAAIDLTQEKAGSKFVAYTVFKEARQSAAHQIKLAEAACDADLAHLLVARACADIDKAALYKERLANVTRARIRMDTGHAAKLARDAINRLLSVNGASSFALANPLQRIWRDCEMGSRHALVLPEVASLIYGRVLFGVNEPIQLY